MLLLCKYYERIAYPSASLLNMRTGPSRQPGYTTSAGDPPPSVMIRCWKWRFVASRHSRSFCSCRFFLGLIFFALLFPFAEDDEEEDEEDEKRLVIFDDFPEDATDEVGDAFDEDDDEEEEEEDEEDDDDAKGRSAKDEAAVDAEGGAGAKAGLRRSGRGGTPMT
jgi:hypothetical protein